MSTIVPPTAAATAKRDQYEVTVVDEFIQAGGASFAFHGSVPIWERQVKHRASGSGRNPSIDVSLFNAGKSEESRIEFGYYTAVKLKSDASKLFKLRTFGVPKGVAISNYLLLWQFVKKPLTNQLANSWLQTACADASSASASGYTVQVQVTACQDVFTVAKQGSTVLQLVLAEVVDGSSQGISPATGKTET
ncbi:MAG: hypothetical protein ABS64_00880 [Microbacterium sp. SCN 69-37]|nr:MAG: hypothetical protein ABS64_00880 [Microbacterium sp. SCN 69-37]